MKLPECLRIFCLRRINRFLADHPRPDFVIGEDEVYLERWHIFPRNPLCNIYLHRFHRSDDDRALHDHPWISCSLIVLGSYIEHRIAAGGIYHCDKRRTGDLVFRSARSAHRIEIPKNEGTVWTVFFTGPRVRAWGFHCPQGWRHWRDFTDPKDPGRRGPGCGD